MREAVNADRVRDFMRIVGRNARSPHRIYFTGGATAVLLGWRSTTIDLDVRIEPETEGLMREIPAIKESLRLNVELASPDHFIPEVEGWRDRSLPIGVEGAVSFSHYDLYSQALAKIERSHRQDLDDVQAMVERKLIFFDQLFELFRSIESSLYKFPAIDPREFRRAVERVTGAEQTE